MQHYHKHNVSYLINYPDNHFISLVEPHGEYSTVLAFDHRFADRYAPIVFIDTDKPMWTQTLHGGNLMNDFHRRLKPQCITHNAKSYALLTWLYIRHIAQVLAKPFTRLR